MVWERLPDNWDNAVFLGDGCLGAILWLNADGAFHIEISRSDLYDHRRVGGAHTVLYSQCRLPNGAFSLRLGDPAHPTSGRMRLDLWNAELRADVTSGASSWTIRMYAHATDGTLVLDLRGPASQAPGLEWHAREARSTRNPSQTPSDYLAYPPAVRQSVGEIEVSVQPMPSDAAYRTEHAPALEHATAWSVRRVSDGHWRYIITATAPLPASTAAQNASERIRAVQDRSDQDLLDRHRDWWHGFYRKSFLSVPEGELERFYWIQMYKMGSASRKSGPLIDLMGPWFRDTGWPAAWWNLNIQLTYWPFYMSNHLDEADPLVDTLWKGRAQLAKNASPHEADSYAIGRATGPTCEQVVGTEVGNLPWVMHNLWLHYRSSMDDRFLAERLLPLMKGSFRYLRHIAVRRDDGSLGLPPTASPEYSDAVEDCSYTLACFRWLCKTILAATKRLGLDDPINRECRDVLDTLAPYPIDPESGVMVGKAMPFAKSHRHWSHLFMIYPFHEWDWHDTEKRALIERSIGTWTALPERFAGYSWLGAASMFVAAGDGDGALQYLRTFLRVAPLPNTLYREGSPVIETPLACARVVQELLLSSHSDVIRVFPALPSEWLEVEFADLRAEGAFLISARRRAGVTEFVSVTSLAGEPCRIHTSIVGELATTPPTRFRSVGEGVIEVELSRGQTAAFHPASRPAPVSLAPEQVARRTDSAPWGGR